MVEQSATDKFWEKALPIIVATEAHPFLVDMVHGTLSMKQFQYYVIQDALYLKDFAYCLRLLSTKCISEIGTERLEAFAKGAEIAELSLHNSFFQQWNINVSSTIQDNRSTIVPLLQMPNTLLYTSYAKQIVATRSYEEGLAVLLPCFCVYAHVGEQMLRLRSELGDR
jgi:thiaminase (transcriptional activator TenA)